MDAPAVAVTRDGKRAVVAWMDMRAGGNNRRVVWRALFRAVHVDSLLANIPTGIQGHPSLGHDSKEAVHIAWEDFRGDVQRIHYRRWDGKDTAISPPDVKSGFPSLACGKVVGVAFELGGNVAFASPP